MYKGIVSLCFIKLINVSLEPDIAGSWWGETAVGETCKLTKCWFLSLKLLLMTQYFKTNAQSFRFPSRGMEE